MPSEEQDLAMAKELHAHLDAMVAEMQNRPNWLDWKYHYMLTTELSEERHSILGRVLGEFCFSSCSLPDAYFLRQVWAE